MLKSTKILNGQLEQGCDLNGESIICLGAGLSRLLCNCSGSPSFIELNFQTFNHDTVITADHTQLITSSSTTTTSSSSLCNSIVTCAILLDVSRLIAAIEQDKQNDFKHPKNLIHTASSIGGSWIGGITFSWITNRLSFQAISWFTPSSSTSSIQNNVSFGCALIGAYFGVHYGSLIAEYLINNYVL